MTNEQIEKKIKELKDLKKKQLKEQKKKQAAELKKIKEKNNQTLADLLRGFYPNKTDEQIIETMTNQLKNRNNN